MSADAKKNHIIISDKANCCGCSACYAKCPENAISMREDDEGFNYPVVDESRCIDCGLCIKNCPQITGNQREKTSCFLAATHREDDVRAISSSGGLFSALAQSVIDRNGVIYGAVYDRDFNVKHIRADDSEWERMRTSKYVQSDMGDIFQSVKADLRSGRTVLFTGTPCQVDGLNKYLCDTDRSGLITCDLICHGVPSPLIWREYLELVKRDAGKPIGKINFRNKRGCGWHDSTLCIEDTQGEVLIDEPHSKALFSCLYFSHYILRPSCFSCRYADLNRAGDITIGDYWGIEKHHPELDDNKGVSLVMVNTDKGHDIIRDIENKCSFTSLNEDECMQPNLKAPAQDYGGRDTFWRAYQKYGLKFAGKRIGLIKASFIDKVHIFGVRATDKLYRMLHSGKRK